MISVDLLAYTCDGEEQRTNVIEAHLGPKQGKSGGWMIPRDILRRLVWLLGACEGLREDSSCCWLQQQGHPKGKVKATWLSYNQNFTLNINPSRTHETMISRWLKSLFLFILFFLLCSYVRKELNQTVKTLFPMEYLSRKQNFQRASCAKWPLPSTRKLFRIFGGKLTNHLNCYNIPQANTAMWNR